jgi:glycerol-3-phosphate cytidylyltransferase
MLTPKKIIGYITMTGDTLHEGHIHVLKVAKSRCDILIVGLTTDDVAKKQKRVPIENYRSRESTIGALRYVDIVTPHNGEPKSEAWRRLQFDVCFTCAEEYLDSREFNELRENCPNVLIIGIPRYPGVSSSRMLLDASDRIIQSMRVITTGIAGPIFRNEDRVWKTIHFGKKDLFHPTRDNYGFFIGYDVLPRNYKHHSQKTEDTFPFISGINPGREFFLNSYFKHKSWSLFEYAVDCPTYPIQENTISGDLEYKETKSLHDFADYIKWERKFPPKTSILVMKFGGITLKQFLETTCDHQIISSIIQQVLSIIEEIKAEGILHGDIHSSNILVLETKEKIFKVSIIDWGWSCAHFFELSKCERCWLVDKLDNNWDKLHFLGSLQHAFPTLTSLCSTFL